MANVIGEGASGDTPTPRGPGSSLIQGIMRHASPSLYKYMRESRAADRATVSLTSRLGEIGLSTGHKRIEHMSIHDADDGSKKSLLVVARWEPAGEDILTTFPDAEPILCINSSEYNFDVSSPDEFSGTRTVVCREGWFYTGIRQAVILDRMYSAGNGQELQPAVDDLPIVILQGGGDGAKRLDVWYEENFAPRETIPRDVGLVNLGGQAILFNQYTQAVGQEISALNMLGQSTLLAYTLFEKSD